MGKNIRIFHIEIIYLIGCNITAVIVIIITKSTFETVRSAYPENKDVSGFGCPASSCILYWFRTKFIFPEKRKSLLQAAIRARCPEEYRISRLNSSGHISGNRYGLS
jgi:hypothetical protein